MNPASIGLEKFDGVIKHSIKSVFDGINEKTEQFRNSFDLLGRFRNAHCEKLASSIDKIQILGMGGAVSLVDLYVPTRFSERIRRNCFIDDEDEEELTTLIKGNFGESNILDHITERKNTLVLGGAGSGKTTFISAFVMGLLGRCPTVEAKIRKKFIPLHFVLRDSPEPPKDLRTLFKQYLREIGFEEAYPFVERMLKKGDICLVLDGLDEVPVANQGKWKDAIISFRKSYPEPPLIMSCRSGSLVVDLPDFEHFEVLPFTRKDSRQFIESWFGEEKEEMAASLQKELRAHPRINELTATPLLLSLLCNLYENDLELSSNRTDLYSRCIDVLMVKWDTSRGFRRETSFQELSISKRRRLFCLIGYYLDKEFLFVLSEKKISIIVGRYIEKFDLEADMAPEVLGELESHHGLLVKPAANYWCFSHKSLQDYFCAEFVRNSGQELDYLKNHWDNPEKWECLVFICSLLEDSSDFMDSLIKLSDVSSLKTLPAVGKRLKAITLLVKCLNQGSALNKTGREKAIHHVVSAVSATAQLLQETGVHPYGLVLGSRVNVRYYYIRKRRRKSTEHAFVPLAHLISEISKSKNTRFQEIIESSINKSGTLCSRLLLASCCFERDPKVMLRVYEETNKKEDLRLFNGKIAEVSQSLRERVYPDHESLV